jgi:type VI secretion system secreted protein Hcp
MQFGSGGGSGKAAAKDLKFMHCLDCSSPNLMQYALIGKHIPSAVLVMRKAGGTPHEYLKITIDDVIITGINMVSAADPSTTYESVSLSFAKVRQEYFVQNAQGGSAGAVTAAYDIKANKEV